MLFSQLNSYQGDVLQLLIMKEGGSNKLHFLFQVQIHNASWYSYLRRKLIACSNILEKLNDFCKHRCRFRTSGHLHSNNRQLLLLIHIQVILCSVALMKTILSQQSQILTSTRLICLRTRLYCHLLPFIFHKVLMQSIFQSNFKMLLSTPSAKFVVLLSSPQLHQQLEWPQKEHVWQLKWPRCWIWSHLPSCSS